MARMIRHEDTGPIELKPDPEGKSAWICACGLSQNLPHCDGSHKLCKQDGGEEPGKLYIYNKERTAVARIEDDAE
ncbi:MAG: CDGSH iron-sulfur domain-containing protein [Planctomycetota bacterium]